MAPIGQVIDIFFYKILFIFIKKKKTFLYWGILSWSGRLQVKQTAPQAHMPILSAILQLLQSEGRGGRCEENLIKMIPTPSSLFPNLTPSSLDFHVPTVSLDAGQATTDRPHFKIFHIKFLMSYDNAV